MSTRRLRGGFGVGAALSRGRRRPRGRGATAQPPASSLAVRPSATPPAAPAPQRALPAPQRALPAPPKRLALPAPGPGLPPEASKPRGGQFWADRDFDGSNVSPEAVARQQANDLSYNFMDFVPEEEGVVRMGTPQDTTVQDWLARSLAKYYKTDFGAPDDPLRDLAARGLHYDVDMTPERWKATVDSYLLEDPIEQVLFPPNRMGGMPGAGSNMRGKTLVAMPWLAKQPVTDKLYGISSGGLDIAHFADELHNALNPEMSGLPADLALRPESLARMSFPQAVERVGRINQFRVKQMDEAAQALANNPAIQTFKDYPDAGYRWVELRQPEAVLPEGASVTKTPGWDTYEIVDPNTGVVLSRGATEDEAIRLLNREDRVTSLQDALKYEGDTMGHCVGGYCDDVLSGRSRIFSLRDAKGQPHVTIETAPSGKNPNSEERNAIAEQARIEIEALDLGDPYTEQQRIIQRQAELADAWRAERAANSAPENIIQIKGKQNRAPVDDYLPYVQDFVKSGTWGNVGDLRNTGLVKLPDGRFITQQQLDEVINSPSAARIMGSPENARTNLAQWNLNTYSDDDWRTVGPLFEGFAIGGRVDADRCFSRSPFGVRR